MTSSTELLQEWEDFMLAQGRSATTLRQYRYAILRLWSETRPAKQLTEITETDIAVFLASLAKRAHSRQLYLQAFRSFFGWAHERGHVEANPAEHFRPKAPSERDPDAFSPEEVGTLMDAARNHATRLHRKTGERNALAIQLAYALGLRRSEVCKITPDDIDWAGTRVLIRQSKGGKSRWVEANELALDALERLRPWWNGTVLGSVTPQWFTMLVNRAARDAGFPPGRRNSHMLRAAFASALMDNGADVTIVSKLLGHSQLSTTMRYRAIRLASRKEAVGRLPSPVQGKEIA